MSMPLLGSATRPRGNGFSVSELVFSAIVFAGLIAFAIVAMVSIFSSPNKALAEAQWITSYLNTKPAPDNQIAAAVSIITYTASSGDSASRGHIYISKVSTTASLYRYSVELINHSASACITYRVATNHWATSSGVCH
jgi:hypothetical protein